MNNNRETWKVKDLKDESLADYSTERISGMVRFNEQEKRHAQEITATSAGVIIAGTAVHRANQAQGVIDVVINIMDLPAAKVPHARNLYDAVPENFKGLIPWLVENHRYYLGEGAPYRGEGKDAKGETINEWLGRLCNWSHDSIRKALVIGKSDFADELVRQMDEDGLSLDAAYHRLKDAENEKGADDDNTPGNGSQKKGPRSRGVIGGNTPAFDTPEDEIKGMKLLFIEESTRLHDKVSGEQLAAGCSLKVNRSRDGAIESYSCTYRTADGTFTAYYIPDEVKKSNT